MLGSSPIAKGQNRSQSFEKGRCLCPIRNGPVDRQNLVPETRGCFDVVVLALAVAEDVAAIASCDEPDTLDRQIRPHPLVASILEMKLAGYYQLTVGEQMALPLG